MGLSLTRATPHPPAAPTAEDARRWEHSGLRMRMLIGRWESDLEHASIRVGRQLGARLI